MPIGQNSQNRNLNFWILRGKSRRWSVSEGILDEQVQQPLMAALFFPSSSLYRRPTARTQMLTH